MLNLLIREDRHWLRKEYLLRFVLVILFFVISSLLIWGIVIVSFYIQLRVEEGIVRGELETIKNSTDSQNTKELLDLNNSIESKINEIDTINFTQGDILREIVLNNTEGINVTLISNTFSSEKKDFFALVEIRGIAESRSSLVDYQEALESLELFEEVRIPFSSFAQNSEIPFSVNIKTVELNEYFKHEN